MDDYFQFGQSRTYTYMQSLRINNDEVNQDSDGYLYHERFTIASTILVQSRVIYGVWLVLANVGGMAAAVASGIAFFLGYYSEFNF